MKHYALLASCLALSACFAGGLDENDRPNFPSSWTAEQAQDTQRIEAEKLHGWWRSFNDPVLDNLVDMALVDSPDRLIAEARVLEARGLHKSARASLFPQIGVSASGGRQDSGTGTIGAVDNFYDAGFDASFEIDIFGKNRKNFTAADMRVESAQAAYHDVSLTLIADIIRGYIDYRAAQNQYRIAVKNLESQSKTLKLIDDLNRLGEAPRLDVERASALVNTTRASLPEFKRQEDNARLRLSVLTGALPETLQPILAQEAEIPGVDLTAVMMSPAQVLALRPDIRAAQANLASSTALAESTLATLFPAFTLSGFYGISDGAFISNANIWSVAVGAAVKLLDFGRIAGQIDAARAREKMAFEQYRKTIISAVVEVETVLSDHANIRQKTLYLQNAYESADKALMLSDTLYREGEASFLDVLDAQRSANNAEAALVASKAAQAQSAARLYKALGVY